MAEWHAHRGLVAAFAIALGLALAGRFLRAPLLAAAAGGAGIVVGWLIITGRFLLPPPVGLATLAALAAGALLVGLLCTWLGPGRRAVVGIVLAALATGWLFAGAPRRMATLEAGWPIGVATACVALVLARALAGGPPRPLLPGLAGLTLAAALYVAAAPPIWVQLALVTGLSGLAMLALPAMPALVALPVAFDLAWLGCLVVLTLGRIPRLGLAAADVAALSPLLAVGLQPRIAARFGLAGRLAPLSGAVLAGALAIGGTWLARELLRR